MDHRNGRSAEIARRKPTQQGSTAAEILARAETTVDEARTAGLEQALAAEAAELAAERGLELTRPRLQRIPYKGAELTVRVPHLRVPGGKPQPPPLLVVLKADPHGISTLLKAGVSGAKMEGVLADLYGKRVRGSSSSSVSRLNVGAGTEGYEEMMARRFDADPGEPIVAAALDGTAIGRTGAKRTVMIVVGITATGRRRLLGSCIAQHEPKEPILELLTQICGRGVNRDIVWTADRGEGIAKALKELGASNVQTCTTHLARNVADKLPEALEQDIRLRLYEAWAVDDPDVALGRLALVADDLQSLGYLDRAGTLRRGMHQSVTLQRLGVPLQARRQLRTTNGLESVNDSVKDTLKLVDFWHDDREREEGSDRKQEPEVPMRLRWAAKRLLELERDSWNRLAEPVELVRLMERTLPGPHNSAAILATLPPSLAVQRRPAAHDERSELPRFVELWCKESPGASWIGSADALARFGVEAGDPVDQGALLLAMQGRHTGTEATLRDPSQISVVRYGPDGQPQDVTVPGVLCVGWELNASPSLQAAWNEADAGGKARLEGAFQAAAGAAVAEVTSTTQPSHGYAAAAAVETSPGLDGEPALRVRGVAVGVVRGRGAKLRSPVAKEAWRAATARNAEDAAQEVLDHALERPLGAEPSREPAREPPAAALLRGVEARAIDQAPAIVGGDPEQLTATAAERDAAFDSLELIGGEVGAWKARHWDEAVREVAGARLRATGPEAKDLWHPLHRGDRLVLGEEASQRLLGESAQLLGRADGDPNLASELKGAPGGALAGLRPAVARVERAAATIAAGQELRRQELFERARAEAESETVAIAELATVDRSGRPIQPSLKRQSDRLGPRLDPFKRYAAAVTAELKREPPNDATLQLVAAELGDPWQDRKRLVPERANQLVGLELKREAVLGELVRTRRQAGRFELEAERAAADKEDRRAVAASDRAAIDRRRAESLRDQLRTLEGELEERAGERGSLDQFLRRQPEAAVQSAVQAERLERARALEATVQTGAEQAAAAELASPGEGIGL